MRCFRQRGRAPASPILAARFGVLAVLAILLAAPVSWAADAADPVGRVNKVQNEVQVISASGASAAVIGTQVHMKDELRTGAGARLQVTFRDNTVLTLGENARLVIDRYVYDPGSGVGETVLQAAAGAFRFATGRMGNLKDKNILVVTPVAQIGVRGTEFWGGPIDGRYGVFLIAGEITVTTQGGSIALSGSGQGTEASPRPTSPRLSIHPALPRPGLPKRSPAPSIAWRSIRLRGALSALCGSDCRQRPRGGEEDPDANGKLP